jgi:hypothetical protein
MATTNAALAFDDSDEFLPVALAVAVNDDDAATWPCPGSHESFVNDIDPAYAPTLLAI